jgi:7,8-dihydropterin-6-yl-methyl-4-(beta-D-ribofuranosyl)aminobenzene 5'-phosphate synthase
MGYLCPVGVACLEIALLVAPPGAVRLALQLFGRLVCAFAHGWDKMEVAAYTGGVVKKLISFVVTTLLMCFTLFPPQAAAQDAPARVTIIYDAFGKPSNLARGWGFSALIEYGGKRILFDTGGRYRAFAENAGKLGINLKSLDFVVISHRHGDHTSGLAYVLQQNPNVKVYAPSETGSFGTPVMPPTTKLLERRVADAPDDSHYFDGNYPDKYAVDSPWPGANISVVDKPFEVMPGFFLFRTVSEKKGTLELNELSMAIKTPKGLVVVVGCSHPGIEKILAAAVQIDSNLYSVVGGLHLVDVSDQEVIQIVENFQQKWKIQRVAAGHCSGEFAQAEFKKQFGIRHDHSGVGEIIALPR